MDVSARAASHYEHRPSWSTSRLAVNPPLGPGALRLSILMELDNYRRLHEKISRHAASDEPSSALLDTDRAGDLLQLKFVQSALRRDLAELSQLTASLQAKLRSKRPSSWILNASIALCLHALYLRAVPWLVTTITDYSPLLLGPTRFNPTAIRIQIGTGSGTSATIMGLLQWCAYPIALYRVFRFERELTDVNALAGDLDRLSSQVEAGHKLWSKEDASSTECLEHEQRWKGIPWGEIGVEDT